MKYCPCKDNARNGKMQIFYGKNTIFLRFFSKNRDGVPSFVSGYR